jgi:hypothetical protein
MAKQYTQAAWARIQSRLPEEDRVPYAESPEKFDTPADVRARIQRFAQRIEPGVTEEEFPTSVTTPRGTATSGSSIIDSGPKRYYNYFTGEYVDDPSKIKPRTGMGGPESGGGTIQVTADAADDDAADDDDADDDDADDDDADDDAADDDAGNGTKTIYTAPDGRIFTDLNAYNAYIAKLKADEKRKDGQSAYDLLFSEFDRYGLGGLIEPLKGFIQDGLSEAEFTLRLRETDAYKKRFAANQARVKNGLRALSEAQYIELEDQYQDVMRRYGMPESYYTRGDMGRQEGFEKFIGGDVSPIELEDRIQTAQNRVVKANPEVSKALREFYPEITGGDILAYALDPAKAIENIKRKVTAAEIGGAAIQSGLGYKGDTPESIRARAEELQRYGVTKETAQQGFGTIASGLERGRQLSKIYKEPDYTQAVAETEVFALPNADKARRQRRKITQLETATFGGTSGAAGGALSRERAGQY